MIELTQEQRRELNQPLTRVRDPQTNEMYVLLRLEDFDRIRHLLDDDVALSKREVSALVERAMREYDEGDPSLHLYQND
jgi:hypothetical protein